MQLVEVLHNARPKRNIGSAKRGKPSEAKSGKPINVVHMSRTFAPSLTTGIIFRRIGSHDRYRKEVFICQWTKKKKLVKVQGCSHKRNGRREYKRL